MDDIRKKVDLLIAHAVQTNERLDSIKENLSEHMRRTELAEERLEVIENEVKPVLKVIENEVKPVLKHFVGLEWSIRMIIGGVALAAGVIKIIELLK